MGTLREARAIGAAGSILVAIGLTSPLILIVILIGLILILVAVNGISQVTNNRDSFNNMAIAAACLVIGVIIGLTIVFQSFSLIIGSSSTMVPSTGLNLDLIGFYNSALASLLVICFFTVIAAIFLKRSFDSIGTMLHVDMFRTVGKLFLIGALLLIVLGIGLIVMLAAAALSVAAFLMVPDEVPPRKISIDPWGRPRKDVEEIPLR